MEEDFIDISSNVSWTPPFKLNSTMDEYLKDWPIDYDLAALPLSNSSEAMNTSKFSEKRIKKQLGIAILDRKKTIEESIEELLHNKDVPEETLTAKTIPSITSMREEKRQRRTERKKQLSKWFDLPLQQVTEEQKMDMEVLRMRQSLDTKHFYRRADRTDDIKYFQMGRIVDSSRDFYQRIPKKQRKQTLVDELLDTNEFMRKQKKRYQKLNADKQAKEHAIKAKEKRLKQVQNQKRSDRASQKAASKAAAKATSKVNVK